MSTTQADIVEAVPRTAGQPGAGGSPSTRAMLEQDPAGGRMANLVNPSRTLAILMSGEARHLPGGRPQAAPRRQLPALPVRLARGALRCEQGRAVTARRAPAAALLAAALLLHAVPMAGGVEPSRPAAVPATLPVPLPAGALPRPGPLSRPATPAGKGAGAQARPPAPKPPAATPTPSAAATRAIRGIASTYGPGWDGWAALPEGPGVRFRVCGPAACAVRTSSDAGPDLAMQRAGRVVDLDAPTFEAVCGCPWTRGLMPVTVERLP